MVSGAAGAGGGVSGIYEGGFGVFVRPLLLAGAESVDRGGPYAPGNFKDISGLLVVVASAVLSSPLAIGSFV